MKKQFLSPKDIMNIAGIAYSTACKDIQGLNNELRKKGIKVYRGKVSVKFYCEKHGISDLNVG